MKVGMLGRSERLLMQRYGIIAQMRRRFTMPDIAFEHMAAYLDQVENPDVLEELSLSLEQIQDGAEALTMIAETARRCQTRREQADATPWPQEWRFDPRGRKNLYQALIEEVHQMPATQRSLSRLGRRLQRAEFLIHHGCSLLSFLERDDLMAQLNTVAPPLVEADVGLVVQLNDDGLPEAFWVHGQKKPGTDFPPEMHFLLTPARTQKTLLLQDLAQYTTQHPLPPQHMNIQRVLSIPVMMRDIPVGVLILGKTVYAPPFDQEDLRLLNHLMRQVSIALENIYLHDEVRHLAQLQERQRIAQDLHDSVVQLLFATGVEAQHLLSELPPQSPLRQRVQRIQRLVARSTADLRGAIEALTQASLRTEEPISVLLQELVEEFEKRAQIEVTLLTPSRWPQLPSQAVQAIYRIVREALTNVQKHAQATAVIVNITFYLDRLVVSIQDNGIGFTTTLDAYQESNLHFGLRTMHQLAERAGGYLEAFNHEEGGAVIRFTLPWPEGAEQ